MCAVLPIQMYQAAVKMSWNGSRMVSRQSKVSQSPW